MVVVVVSASALIANALENSLVSHFETVEKCPRIEAVTAPIAEIEALVWDLADVEADVESLLQFGKKETYFLARIAAITRENLDITLLTRLVGKVGAILPHSCGIDNIAIAARLMRPGLTILSTELLSLLPAGQTAQSTSNVADRHGLTEREKAVLGLLAQGASNRTIGNALGINDITVRVHVRSILHKLGVTNRTQAALFVVRGGVDS